MDKMDRNQFKSREATDNATSTNEYRSQLRNDSTSSESDAIVLSSDDEDSSETKVLSSQAVEANIECTNTSSSAHQSDTIKHKMTEIINEKSDSTGSNNDENYEYKEVTKDVYEQHVAKIGKISSQIDQYEGLLKFSSHLPDQGDKLKKLMAKLKLDLAQYKIDLRYMSIKEPSSLEEDFENMTLNTDEPSYDNIEHNFLKKVKQAEETMPNENDLADQPKLIQGNLMKHQRQALAWMIWREQQFPRGGILGDDMGLGKTLTMIALIARGIELRENNTDTVSGELIFSEVFFNLILTLLW